MSLLTNTQKELMYKFYDLFQDMSEEDKNRILEELNIELTDEELAIIKEEQDKLLQEREEYEQFREFYDGANQQLSQIIKTSYIPGLEVGDTY